MAIDGGMRKQLAGGMRLVAKYRKQQHTAEVVAGEDGNLRFRLADGRDYSSPSAAGSAVMNGIACNGWRFWSLQTDDADAPAKIAAKQPRAKGKPAAKPARRDARRRRRPRRTPSRSSRRRRAAEPIAAAE